MIIRLHKYEKQQHDEPNQFDGLEIFDEDSDVDNWSEEEKRGTISISNDISPNSKNSSDSILPASGSRVPCG